MMTMAMMIMITIIMLLIIRAEERHKLVTASLNFYKTAEQVPTLPTISFPSLLSTSSYHHRAGANHHHCHHHHHHHVKVCSVLDSLEREYKREDDWLSRHVVIVMIYMISLLSSSDHHHRGNNWHNINVIFIITIFTIANINTITFMMMMATGTPVLTTTGPPWSPNLSTSIRSRRRLSSRWLGTSSSWWQRWWQWYKRWWCHILQEICWWQT